MAKDKAPAPETTAATATVPPPSKNGGAAVRRGQGPRPVAAPEPEGDLDIEEVDPMDGADEDDGEAAPATYKEAAEKPKAEDIHAPAEPDEDEFSDDLLEEARLAGFDEDTARAMTPKVLEKVLFQMDKAALGDRRKPKAEEPKPEPKAEPKPAVQEPTTRQKKDWAAYLDKLKAEYEDETLPKALKEIIDHFEGELELGRNEVKQVREHHQRQAAIEQIDRFDDLVEDLGAEWKEVFGKGRASDVQGAHLEARSELYDTVNELIEVQARRGKAVRGLPKAIFQKALRITQADRTEKAEKAKVSEAAEKRTRAISPRPTHREPAPRNPTSTAVRNVSKEMTRRGVSGYGPVEDEGLPE